MRGQATTGDGAPVRQSVTLLVGVTLGSVLAVVEVGFIALASITLIPVIAVPRSREPVIGFVHRCSRHLAVLEQWRLARFHQVTDLGPYSDRSAFRYITRRWTIGLLGGLVLLLLVFGVGVAVSMVSAWLFGGTWAFIEDGGGVSLATLVVAALPGAVLLYLNLMGIVGIRDLDARIARRHLAPSAEEVLARRVSELTMSRAEVVQVVNDERRRIERDLHDGVQQRLVALGLLLSRARRAKDPDQTAELLRQAHEASEQALNDLRDVAWRVYPTVLDQLGLRDVIAVLAERSSIPVNLRYDLPERPSASTETVAYFFISEAVTNAAKHSGAQQIEITVAEDTTAADVTRTPAIQAQDGPVQDGLSPDGQSRDGRAVADQRHVSRANGWAGDGRVVITVADDGRGGADPTGRGLTGLAGRVTGSDGTFTIHSPPGGPTILTAMLPST